MRYYYKYIETLILYSGLCTIITNAVNRNFYTPSSNYTNWSDCGSDQCSMAFEYYNI